MRDGTTIARVEKFWIKVDVRRKTTILKKIEFDFFQT